MADDVLTQNTPVAQVELGVLQTTKVGDVRQGLLFPAFEVGVEWLCTATETPVTAKGQTAWEFEGRFFGQLLCRIRITEQAGQLSLVVKASA